VLAAAGLKAAVLPFSGAGRTLISKGLLPQAQQHARRMLQTLEAWDPQRRIPVLGIEPSEIYTFKDEYLDLLPGEAGVSALAKRTFMLDEFLLRKGPQGESYIDALHAMLGAPESRSVLMHGHCYQKAQPPADDGIASGAGATAALLTALGFEVQVVNSGCCGMAGSFGYEAEHYDVSMQIGELALFPAVRQAPAAQHVVAAGVSCRAQIASGTGREALHPVELIAAQLKR
jgi:Fe-S oxidoreductase